MNCGFASNRTRRISCLAFTLSIVVLGSAANGQTPSILSIFKKKQDDRPGVAVELRPEHGPWLILATTFSGPDAESTAAALAGELQTSLRVPCFVMQRSSDGMQVLGQGERIVTDPLDGSRSRIQVNKK